MRLQVAAAKPYEGGMLVPCAGGDGQHMRPPGARNGRHVRGNGVWGRRLASTEHSQSESWSLGQSAPTSVPKKGGSMAIGHGDGE